MLPPPKRRKVIYLSNTNLLSQVAKSKNSYSVYLDDEHARYDSIIEVEEGVSVADTLDQRIGTVVSGLDGKPRKDDDGNPIIIGIGSIVRVHTYEHIPLDPDRASKARERNKTHAKVSFHPFQHWLLTDAGWTLVGLSHWTGGLSNGHFDAQAGRMTEELGRMIWMIAENYARKGSWRGYSYRDEMIGTALENLMAVALQFNEARSDNPFSYYTTCLANSFRKVWRQEEQHQSLRDDLLIANGSSPSMSRQVRDEMAQFEPTKLVAKRGRPKTK